MSTFDWNPFLVNQGEKLWIDEPRAGVEDSGAEFLDLALRRLKEGTVGTALKELFRALEETRAKLGSKRWREFISLCHSHPVAAVLREDPMTRRSFERPRGYAGDAVILDYVYSGTEAEVPEETTALGRQILHHLSTEAPSCVAVRERRDLLARRLDEVAARVSLPRVASIACGHLREASRSKAVVENRIGLLLALDQDSRTLSVVQKELAVHRVSPLQATVRDLLKGGVPLSSFDLIYSAGLYDYLQDDVAACLTDALFRCLNPRGTLLIANCVPNFWGTAYMESFMGWPLICRTVDQLVAAASLIYPRAIEERRIYESGNGIIAYLELTKS